MAAISDVIRVERRERGFELLAWLTTTDHKAIGVLYLTASFTLFFIAGLMALAMRTELAQPGLQVMNGTTYDSLFTMHGTIMMLLFATPAAIGFANYFIPLQIGAADMAFPRLNALTFWMFLFGSIIVLLGFGTQSGAAQTGWTAYAPLSEDPYAPGPGFDLWIAGLALTGVSSVLGAVNFITTIYARRAPGMRMFRMPIFTWNMLVTAVLMLFAFPPLTAALAMLWIDRHFAGGIFDPARGGDPVLWQHLFWFFGHPEVYIVVLPSFGIVSEIFPVFSRKPLFGYRLVVAATILIAAYSMTVWAHHMFTTGFVNLPFFSIMSFLIAVPTGVKIFNWTATMFGGRLRFTTAMLFSIGLLYVFVIGGISGVMVASPPLDYQFQDTYFVVAHMHNVLIGGTVFGFFAGLYYWFPKMTGRFLDERLGRLHWLAWMVGFTLTFVPQYQLGAEGMPRRIADYGLNTGWGTLNLVSTVGALILGLGTLPLLLAIARALRQPPTAGPDPWEGNSLEWATSSPPPHHNFAAVPRISSERPVFDERMRRLGVAPAAMREGGGPRLDVDRPELAEDARADAPAAEPSRPSAGPGTTRDATRARAADRAMRFPEEAAFFARSAVFAVAIAVVYWFVSYEWAGSVLLFAFGIASALGAIMLGRAAAGRAARAHEAEPGLGADGPFGDETGPIPAPTFAPIVVAAGLALAALGMAFGPWLPLAGAMPIVLGAASWLSAANHEWRGQDTDER